MVKKSMKKLFVGLAVLSTVGSLSASADSTSFSIGKNFFQPRPASANIAREMLMEPAAKHRQSEGWYGEFSATAFYQRSWNQEGVETALGEGEVSDTVRSDVGFRGLGAMPFWSGTNIMAVGNPAATAAAIATTTPNVDSYQFGLGATTSGTANIGAISLSPIVYQAGADFMFIVGSSAMEPGFFAKIKAPIACYNINPQFLETPATTGTAYPAGSLGLTAGTANYTDPASSMAQALAGLATAQGDYTPIVFGKIDGQQSTGAKFGDIEMTAGYSFVSNEDNSFSVAVRASAPTGNKATGVYMLEPIVGRGGNWGLGGYAAGHVKLWEGNNDNRFTFKFMTDVMHLFTTSTVRSYDTIDNGPGSKYMLVANFPGATTSAAGVHVGGSGTIQNLINLTTLESNSSFGVEGDLALAFNYASNGWSLDLGYEFYGRSSEELEITGVFEANTWGILGHQGVGLTSAGSTVSNAVQPFATMQHSAASVGGTANTVTTIATASTPDLVTAPLTGNLLNGNLALDKEAAEQKAYLSSKIFSKVAYEWENSDYVPFLGVIGEFEFSNNHNNALPQWSVAIVGGVSF